MTAMTKISASLGRKLLANSDKYFTNDDATILDELIQNARRAGASTVTFSIFGSDLIVADDGHGLPAENAGVLLALGDSDNDEAIETAENAAGLGFFSLANFDVEVSSRDWVMSVPRAAFTGKADASLQTVKGFKAGLSIRIQDFLKGKQASDTMDLARKGARYSGLIVRTQTASGEFETQEPLDFLQDHLPTVGASASKSGFGVTVRVLRVASDSYERAQVNFFGKVISTDAFDRAIPVFEEYAFLSKSGSHIDTRKVSNRVLIDVEDTSVLKLQLPQRQALIQGGGIDAVSALVREAYVSLLKQPGLLNGLAITSDLRKAHKDIPLPSCLIHAADGTRYVGCGSWISRHGTSVPVHRALAMEASSTGPTDVTLIQAMFDGTADGVLGNRIFDGDDLVKAFPAGSFGAISRIEAILVNGDDEHVVELSRMDPAAAATLAGGFANLSLEAINEAMSESDADDLYDAIIDSVAIRFIGTDPDGNEEVFAHPVPGIFFGEYGDDPTIIISRGHDQRLPETMLDVLDWYSDDYDAGSFDEQKSYHRSSYLRAVAKIIGDQFGAFVDELNDKIRDLLYGYELSSLSVGPLELKLRVENGDRVPTKISIERLAA